jgi:hypothetical protein
MAMEMEAEVEAEVTTGMAEMAETETMVTEVAETA